VFKEKENQKRPEMREFSPEPLVNGWLDFSFSLNFFTGFLENY